MSVDRLPQTRYFSGRDQQQRAARANLEIIMKNLNALAGLRGGEKLIQAAKSMSAQKEQFTDNQINYITGIYEKIFEANGFESCKIKHDFGKRKLRF